RSVRGSSAYSASKRSTKPWSYPALGAAPDRHPKFLQSSSLSSRQLAGPLHPGRPADAQEGLGGLLEEDLEAVGLEGGDAVADDRDLLEGAAVVDPQPRQVAEHRRLDLVERHQGQQLLHRIAAEGVLRDEEPQRDHPLR